MVLTGTDLADLGVLIASAKMTLNAHWNVHYPAGRATWMVASNDVTAAAPTAKLVILVRLLPNDITITLEDVPANLTSTRTINRDVTTTLANGLTAIDQCFNDFVTVAH